MTGNGAHSPLVPGRRDRPTNGFGACLVAVVLLGAGFVFGLMWGVILWR